MIYAAGNLTRHAARMMVVSALLLSGHVWAGSNPEVDRANALYGAGNYQEALDVYDRLAKEQPDNPALQFNRGAALYQLGDLPKAREAFEQAGVLSEDAQLQARSAYNLGNCAFKEGQEKVAQDPDAAMASLNRSMGYYKDALARDKSIDAAAHNLEMVKRTIQELRRQQQQQEQERQQKEQQQKQQEQQKKEETKEKLDELIEEQQQQNQQSEQAAQQQRTQQSDPSQPAPTPEQMEAMKQQQEQTRDKTEDLAEQMTSPGDPAPEPESKSSAKDAVERQKEAEEHLKNQNAEAANKAQEEALEKLKEARKALDAEEKEEQQSAEDNKNKNQQEQPEKPEEKSGENNKPEETGKMDTPDDGTPPPDANARDILNQEKRNKEQRDLRRMIGVAPVEKDW